LSNDQALVNEVSRV